MSKSDDDRVVICYPVGAQEVEVWQCLPSVPGDPASHQAGHGQPRTVHA